MALDLPEELKPFASAIEQRLKEEQAGTITEKHQDMLNEMRARGVRLPDKPGPAKPKTSAEAIARTAGLVGEEVSEGIKRVKTGLSVILEDPKNVGVFDPVQLPLGLAQIFFAIPTGMARQSGETVARESGIPALGVAQEMMGSAALGSMYSKGLGAGARGMKFLPGGQAARAELAIEKASELPGMLRPPRPSEQIYRELAAFNPKVQLSKFRNEVARLLAIQNKTSKGNKDTKLIRSLKGFQELFDPDNDFLDADQMIIEYKGINTHIGEGGRSFGAFKALKAALQSDLDDAVVQATTKEAVTKLREASKAFRKELAAERLERIVQGAISERRGGLMDLNPQTILKRLRTDKFFAERIDKSEMDAIRKTLNELNKNPPVPPPSSTNIGFGRIGSIGAAGYTSGYLMRALGFDIPTEAFVGMGLGAITANAVITKALLSDFGRKQLIRLSKTGPLDPMKVAALAMSLRVMERSIPAASQGQQLQQDIQSLTQPQTAQ